MQIFLEVLKTDGGVFKLTCPKRIDLSTILVFPFSSPFLVKVLKKVITFNVWVLWAVCLKMA